MTYKTNRRPTPVPFTAALIAFAGVAAAGPVPYQWALPVDGFWNDPLNWNPSGVPGLTDDVELGLTGPYTISLGPATQDAANFHITNPQAALHIINSRSLRIRQGIVNHGQIVLNPNNEPRAPVIVLADGSTIAGSGVLRLGAPGFLAQLAGFFIGDSTTQHAGHTIAGMGSVSIDLNNHGTVIADAPGSALTLSGQFIQNHAAFSAVNAGILDIRAPMSQSDQGSTLASGAGSRIEIHAPQVTGGSLGAANDASVRLLTTSKTINSARLHGDFSIQPGITVTLEDTHFDGVNMAIDPTPSAPTAIAIASGSSLEDATITLTDAQHRLETTSGPGVASFSENVTIQGRGTIKANAVNHGAIRADQPDGVLTIFQSTIDHHGELDATSGATIVVKESILTQAPGSSIRAAGPGSIIRFEYATTGGEMVSTDGGIIQFGSAPGSYPRATLQSATLQGLSEVLPETYLTVNGPLVNNGTLRVHGSTNSSRQTRIEFADNSSITGSGAIEFGNGSKDFAPQTPGATITLGADQTITGSGTISVGMVIDGTVRTEMDQLLRFIGPPVTSRNVLHVSGGEINIATGFIQQSGSRIMIDQGGRVSLSTTQSYPAQVVGGVIDIAQGASFTIRDALLQGVTINGDSQIRNGRDLEIADSFTNNGTLAFSRSGSGSSSLQVLDSLTVNGSGAITFAEDFNRASVWGPVGVAVAFGPEQRLEGSARFDVPITVHGRIAPGFGVGAIYSYKAFTFAPTATLEIDIASDTADYLWTPEVHVDGTVEVRFVDGFNPPSLYWDRIIMSAVISQTGAFHTVTGPELPDPRLEYRVRYINPYFRVGTYCKADVNSDRQLNFFDVSAFINLFNAGDPAADIAAPFGTINFFDLSAYINRFNDGCP